MNGFEPYPYQNRVREVLLGGKSAILQAPTGAGKTLAALMPFMEGLCRGSSLMFPQKCLYVVPMRVLANQFLNSFEEYLEPFRDRLGRKVRYSILTGEQPEDPEFNSDLIFCTVDQFLSSYLCMPYSLSGRLANFNAGAITGSYLVFDEFHLLDPESTLASVWHAIQRLHQVAPVLLMTATFSQTMLQSQANTLQAEVITVPQVEAEAIERRKTSVLLRQRTWQTASNMLSADAVLAEHNQRTLVLCNTVQRAQDLFCEIQERVEKENKSIKVLLLHSRFLPEDRKRIEQNLHRLFGKGKGSDSTGSVIAVATQAIEVGVDITSEILHTELAPASALIQRAGRCARYPGEQGKVIVYPVETYRPYAASMNEAGWGREMHAAYDWLQQHSGEAFDFGKEQAFVNAVATPRDAKVIAGLSAGHGERHSQIVKTLKGDREAADRNVLIRDANSCRVLIHPEPDLLLENPKTAVGFNLQPSTLMGLFKRWEDQAQQLNLDWTVKILLDPPGDQHEDNQSEYCWKPIFDAQLLQAARVVVVHPALAGYHPDKGFLPHTGNTDFRSTLTEQTSGEAIHYGGYQLESYQEHVERVLRAFEEVALPELEMPMKALEKAAKWRTGSLFEAAWLTCLLHDVGKLSTGWQAWAQAHQNAVGNPISPTFAVAHTDTKFNDETMQQAAKEAIRHHPKPHHAAEGALATAPILFNEIQPKELAQAAFSAITRHHSPFASDCQPFQLVHQASQHIAASVPPAGQNRISKIYPENLRGVMPAGLSLNQLIVQPEDCYAWLAYTLMVRALRKADQIGTSYGTA